MADRKEWKEQLLSKLLDQYEKSVTYVGENKVKQVFSVKPSDIFKGYNKDFLPPEQLFQEKEFERLIRQMESEGLIHVVPPNTGILRQICAVPERWEDCYACLNRTEKNILKEIALGKTTKEIAAEKNLSFHTINSHRKNIFRKLGVNNVHEATKYAMRAGIVDLAEYYI